MDKTKLIKLIYVAKRQLQMDEDVYRNFLVIHTKKGSLKEMQVWELEKVIKHLKLAGFKIKSAKESKSLTPQAYKIIQLWKNLSDLEIVENPGREALNSYINRQTGVEKLEWLNKAQSSNVIESLKIWLQREE